MGVKVKINKPTDSLLASHCPRMLKEIKVSTATIAEASGFIRNLDIVNGIYLRVFSKA